MILQAIENNYKSYDTRNLPKKVLKTDVSIDSDLDSIDDYMPMPQSKKSKMSEREEPYEMEKKFSICPMAIVDSQTSFFKSDRSQKSSL